jgi:hypothetical protein
LAKFGGNQTELQVRAWLNPLNFDEFVNPAIDAFFAGAELRNFMNRITI